jgi:DNA-binding SARP family transcriptional activator
MAITRAEAFGALPYLRWWLRRYASIGSRISQEKGGIPRILRVTDADFDFWMPVLVGIVSERPEPARREILTLIGERGDRDTADRLLGIAGTDIAKTRQQLLRRSADRLFIRTFGPMTVHRNAWDGPEVRVEKRRLRQLLGLLVANRQRTLTREMALEILWPDNDPAAAANNLNQAVFQLRKHLDGGSRDPDRPQYVLSSPDALALETDLTITDVDEVRRLATILAGATTAVDRQAAAIEILSLIRGEFLADLRYEDWTASFQMSVAAEIRAPLLLIATGRTPDIPPHLSLQAAELLTEFDPFDEPAQVAMARKLYEMGRRSAARKLITQFAASIHEEMDVNPSADVREALTDLGAHEIARVQ